MNHLLRHTTVFLALLTLLLTACGRSAPTHFYLLDSGQPPLTADSLPAASLSIAPVSVPDYLDRNGLVRRSDGQTRLEVSELDIWAEPLGQGARRVLGEVLAARLLPRGIDVIAAGDRQGDMELAVALERLDGDTPGTARLAGPLAAFPWRRGAGSRHLRSQRGCRHEQRQSGGGPEPSVAGTGRTSGRPPVAPPQGRTLATARFPIIRPPAQDLTANAYRRAGCTDRPGTCGKRIPKPITGQKKGGLSLPFLFIALCPVPVPAPHRPCHPTSRRFTLHMKNAGFVQSERLPGMSAFRSGTAFRQRHGQHPRRAVPYLRTCSRWWRNRYWPPCSGCSPC